MRIESSGKPDAWKLARPVWGWGRGAIPRPTPLRGLLLVFSLFALSFGLLRKAYLIADAGNVGDDTIFVICFGGGLQVFLGTIGAVIERLIDSRRRGTVGVLISIALVWSFVWFAYVVGTAMSRVSNW